MMAYTPAGMPPWWNKRVTCRHCGGFIRTFTPKNPAAWQRELEAINELAAERCYCRKSPEEIVALLKQPVDRNKEHALHRIWLYWALAYHREMLSGLKSGGIEWESPVDAKSWSSKSRPKERTKRSARRSARAE